MHGRHDAPEGRYINRMAIAIAVEQMDTDDLITRAHLSALEMDRLRASMGRTTGGTQARTEARWAVHREWHERACVELSRRGVDIEEEGLA